MSEYARAVERNLEGLTAVSTGLCPTCDECRDAFDEYRPELDDWTIATEFWAVPAIDSPHFRMRFPSESLALDAARTAFHEAWSCGQVTETACFSYSGCDICGSSLGGDMVPWHAITPDGRLLHFDNACVDCVMYIAYGEEP